MSAADSIALLEQVRRDARQCTACPLWQYGTQTVFGEGNPEARLMLVGEQPGDAEDLAGHPFVGPAGKILERALGELGLVRDDLYITNAVKHFKWELRGQRRIHKTPGQKEITACHPWLEAELNLVKPALVVCLGATALRALLGRSQTLTGSRGRILHPGFVPALLATIHPSYVLRVPAEARDPVYRGLVEDLRAGLTFLAGETGQRESGP